MEAKLTQVGEVIIVSINGRLDIDKTKPLYEACVKNLLDKKVVFNLQSLNFVGSTGIQHFFQLIRDVNAKNKYGLRVAGMTPDFQRVWSLSQDPAVSIFDNTHTALMSFNEPQPSSQAATTATEVPPQPTTGVSDPASGAALSSEERIS